MAKIAHSIAYQTDNALWSSICAARHLSLADLNKIREHAIAALPRQRLANRFSERENDERQENRFHRARQYGRADGRQSRQGWL